MGKRNEDDSDAPILVNPENLQADLKAFAASLGLAGQSSGGDFDDFAPGKAKQRIGSVKAPASAPVKPAEAVKSPSFSGKRQRGDTNGDRGTNGITEVGRGKNAAVGSKAVPSTEAAPVKTPGREWNVGAGPRPGGVLGKSLLGKEEPSSWHQAAALLPVFKASEGPVDPDLFERLRVRCEKLMETEGDVFEKSMAKRSSADSHWLQQVKRSGTTQDKVAAMTLLVQESVIANVKSLDSLTQWVAKRSGGREVVRQAMEALQELFCNVLLPDRKLRFLEQQPLQSVPSGKEGDKVLLYWYVEDCIKRRYAQFLEALESASKDQLDFIKEKATKTISALLARKPEGEAKLLSALVNKLGDPDRKLASKAGYLMAQLLLEHPGMKPVVVREVERFLFRPGMQERARYYCVVFLNQLALSHKEAHGGSALAKKLIDLYFTLFKMLVEGNIGRAAEVKKVQDAKWAIEKKKFFKKRDQEMASGKKPKVAKIPKKPVAEEMDARIMSGLIAGVRRAFPYVSSEDVEPLIDKHSGHLFRMAHTAPFSVAVQALMLMYQLMAARHSVSDRFYRALYAVLLTEGPTTSSKAPMFLALLFKAMKSDVSVRRVSAFAKRLLQAAAEAPANFAAGSLFLLSEVLQAQPAMWAALTQPEDVASTAEAFTDAPLPDSDEEETFQDAADPDDEPQSASLHSKLKGKAVKGSSSNGDAEERETLSARINVTAAKGKKGSAVDATSAAPLHTTRKRVVWPAEGYYDMDKREPLYCGGERCCWWELTALASHVQPSVAAMARTLLSGCPIVYDGDPLRDHNLTSFLDKFIQKKPKSHAKGSSLMQPIVAVRNAGGKSAAAVGSDAFASLDQGQVLPADMFFHKFYNLQVVKAKRAIASGKKAKKVEGSDSDDDPLDGPGGSEDDVDMDAFLDAEEDGTGGDEKFGEPDIGHSYDDLADAMLAGRDVAGSDSDAEEDEGAEGDAEDSDSLDGMNVNDLPSASEEGEEQQAGSSKRRNVPAARKDVSSDEEGADSSDGEEEGEDVEGGTSDDDEDDMGLYSDGSDEGGSEQGDEEREGEEEDLPPQKDVKRKKPSAKSSGGMSDFASADDYAHLFKQLDENAANDDGQGAGEDGVEDERGGREKGRGRGRGRGGAGRGKGRSSSQESGEVRVGGAKVGGKKEAGDEAREGGGRGRGRGAGRGGSSRGGRGGGRGRGGSRGRGRGSSRGGSRR